MGVVTVDCVGCGRALQVPESAAGTVARCPHCRALLRIPPAPSAASGQTGSPAPKRKAAQASRSGAGRGRSRVRILPALAALLLVAAVAVAGLVAWRNKATNGHVDSVQANALPVAQASNQQPDTPVAAVQKAEPKAEAAPPIADSQGTAALRDQLQAAIRDAEANRARAWRAEKELENAKLRIKTATDELERLRQIESQAAALQQETETTQKAWQNWAAQAQGRLAELDGLRNQLAAQEQSDAQTQQAWQDWAKRAQTELQNAAERERTWQEWAAKAVAEVQRLQGIERQYAALQQAYAQALAALAGAQAARQTPNVRSVAPAGAAPLAGTQLWLRQKIDGGNMLVLSDGSLWEVAGIDRYKTRIWLPTETILVAEWTGGSYPYKLVNTSQGDAAQAKYVGRG